jgi:putative ABC transport system permease protein
VSLQRELAGDSRPALLLLLAAVGALLLAACTNVASLFLTRGVTRSRELAVRAALGAGRGRLVRQLFAESLMLAIPAALAGLGLAQLGLPLVRWLVPPQRALSASLELDASVLGFTTALSVLAVLGFGLLPALRVARPASGANALARGEGGTAAGRTRALLVVGEVAVALLLVAEAGLLVQSLERLRGQYAELRPETLLTLRTALSIDRYWEATRRTAFYEEVLEGVESLPGVRSAGFTTSLPLEWRGGGHEIVLEGRPADPGRSWYANHRQVSSRYLQTLGVGLLEGRYFEPRDAEGAPLVAIVNETLARRFWPGLPALGQRLALAPDTPWRRVVGVVADVRQMGVAEPVQAEVYLPQRQVTSHGFLRPRDLVLRVEVDPRTLLEGVREVVHGVDPLQPVALVRTYAEILNEASAARQVQGGLLAAFAVLALLLAALGIYGVLAHWVAQRTREIGVRLALGARPQAVVAAVLLQGARLTGLGIGLGWLACAAVAPVVRHLLFGVTPADARTHLSVVALLAFVALAACLGPARRAARVDPAESLRAE